MPMNDYSKHRIEKFRLAVEQLEICRDLIKSSSDTKARIAIILLDNIAEVLMYRHCFETFSSADFTKFIVPQRFPSKTRREVLKYFDEKVVLFQTELKLIPNTDAIVLRIGHSYRNAAFHRDMHNQATISMLARILFKTVCSLFAKVYDNGISEFYRNKRFKWLSTYGLLSNQVSYAQAAAAIAKKLKGGIQTTLPTARKAFASDIENRLAALEELVRHNLPSAEEEFLDRTIKAFEFLEKGLEEPLSQSYREAIYSVTSGSKAAVSGEELLTLESSYKQEMQQVLEAFTPTVTWKSILELQSLVIKLRNAQSVDSLLEQYQKMDEALSKFERYLDQAANEWDREIQLEIDRRLGK